MRIRRIAFFSALTLLGLIVGTAGVLYCLVSRRPSDYEPARLTHRQKQDQAYRFFDRVQEFNNKVQRVRAFTFRLSQQELNRYLAAMDEIAALREDEQRTKVYEGMEEQGVSGPAVALRDGSVTFMIRSDAHHKILSADVAIGTTAEKAIRVRLTGFRVGVLPLPTSLVREELRRWQDAAAEPSGDPQEPGASAVRVGGILKGLVAAIDRGPLPTRYEWDGKPIRIDEVRVQRGELMLSIAPDR